MESFDLAVAKQLKTMDELLFLQSEIERCQQLEKELIQLKNEQKLESIQQEIERMNIELKEIQLIFEKQTEEAIQSYQTMGITSA
ncbi:MULTISPECIES: YgaB family protein [Bacillus]|uniref:YgaB family protein n=1 Tax=Bacillus TaxID=1386 RepID=UPI000BB7601A|nr:MULTISPECIES: YgaB family protein [Bacillus]